MSLYSIAAKYNGSLEAAHAHITDDRYDMVECGSFVFLAIYEVNFLYFLCSVDAGGISYQMIFDLLVLIVSNLVVMV